MEGHVLTDMHTALSAAETAQYRSSTSKKFASPVIFSGLLPHMSVEPFILGCTAGKKHNNDIII